MFCMFNDLILSPTRCSYYAHFSNDWAGTWCIRTTAGHVPKWVVQGMLGSGNSKASLITLAPHSTQVQTFHGDLLQHMEKNTKLDMQFIKVSPATPPQPLPLPGQPGYTRSQLGPCPPSSVLTRRLGVWSSLTCASPSSVHPTPGQPPALRDRVPPPSRQPGEVHVRAVAHGAEEGQERAGDEGARAGDKARPWGAL